MEHSIFTPESYKYGKKLNAFSMTVYRPNKKIYLVDQPYKYTQ